MNDSQNYKKPRENSDVRASGRRFASGEPRPLADRLPPHSIEAEEGVIGCCLLSPVDCIGDAVEKLKQPEAFYDLRHQVIFAHMLAMWETQTPVDLITLQNHLRAAGELEKIGGLSYLSSLPDKGITAFHLDSYCDIVRRKYVARLTIQLCTAAVLDLHQSDENLEEQLDKIESGILQVNTERVTASERSMKEIMRDEVIPTMEDYHRGGAQMAGLPTGFSYLDKMICGMGAGDMVVVAARPGAGKTSLIMNIAENLAVKGLARMVELPGGAKSPSLWRVPVGVFSLEMTNKSLGSRLLFQHAPADYQRFRTGYFQNDDIPKLLKASTRVGAAPIWIDDTPGITLMDLRARARRWARQYGIKVFIIDYLQLMKPGRYYDNREKEVAEISNGIKQLAKELKVPFIVAAQMNRGIEKDANRLPQLSDLRESGSIEQDADMVWFLYEPKMKAEKEEKFEARMIATHGSDWSDKLKPVNLLIAKQRNGPTGVAELVYHKSSMRFEDAWPASTKPSDDDQPETRSGPMPTNAELGL